MLSGIMLSGIMLSGIMLSGTVRSHPHRLLMNRSLSIVRLGFMCGIALSALGARTAAAQDNPTGDPVIARIYDIGMHHSQAAELGEVLMDSIGPRLTGSPANRAANDWLVRTYTAWGIPAHNEKYGTWRDWTRGQSRVELVAPHAKTMEATMLAWSPATPTGGTTGEVVMLPHATDSASFNAWLSTVRGKFVLVSYPQPTCRPDTDWKAWASPAIYAAMAAARDSDMARWRALLAGAGVNTRTLTPLLEKAGAAGLLSNRWSEGWGVDK